MAPNVPISYAMNYQYLSRRYGLNESQLTAVASTVTLCDRRTDGAYAITDDPTTLGIRSRAASNALTILTG